MTRTAAIVVLTLLLGTTGCGSGDQPADPPGTPAQAAKVAVKGTVATADGAPVPECSVAAHSKTPGVSVLEMASISDAQGHWQWRVSTGATYTFSASCEVGGKQLAATSDEVEVSDEATPSVALTLLPG